MIVYQYLIIVFGLLFFHSCWIAFSFFFLNFFLVIERTGEFGFKGFCVAAFAEKDMKYF